MTRRILTALSLVLAGLLSSCADQTRTPTGPLSDGSALTAISDGSRGGNPEFFWLPPTVPTGPAITGPFDATALSELVVEICELDASNACVAGDPKERFTATGNPVPQRITVNTIGEYYTVDWLTGRSHVDVDKLYRVRVLRNGEELGFIDVQFVQNTPDLSGVDRTQYVGVKRGQQLTIRFRIDEPTARTYVRLNEIESTGGVPGDWIELYNTAAVPLSLAGYVVRDEDDTHSYTLPAGSIIPAGGFYVIEESELGFGLDAADAVRFFATGGATMVDSYSWTSPAPYTYGRCPDGTGAMQNTTVITKGSANDCTTPPVVVVINEIESSGGVPGDWVEIFNPGPLPANISGFVFKDNDDTHGYVVPAGTIVPADGYFVIGEETFGFGLGSADAARLFRPDGSIADSHTWSGHAVTTYGRCPDGVGEFITTTRSTRGTTNDCSNPVVINEIESSGGVPGDWVELHNPSPISVDVSGYRFKDNDDSHTAYVIPAGTTIAAGGYVMLEEAAFAFGLGAADAARLWDSFGVLVDSYSWTAHAATTYGRCPNGTGSIATTTSSTKGAANSCGTVQPPAGSPWPGDAEVVTADGLSVFGGNLSGLTYEATGLPTPGVLWAVRNAPGTLYRLVWDGSIYTPDGGDWASGRTLRYPDGTGNVDAEGVTFAQGGSSAGIYVASERDNNVSSVSRMSILRYDVTTVGPELTATHEWNLNLDLPAVGANLGLEAVTWVPDAALVAAGFFDETANHVYNPAEYANHDGGLFLVGLEANGTIYAYALNHVTGGYSRVATIATGSTVVKALEFDQELNQLWALCGAGCANRSSLLKISAATGRFVVVQQYERPGTMPNISNEGFAFASLAECVGGKRPVYWADDAETGGHSIRKGTLTCTPF